MCLRHHRQIALLFAVVLFSGCAEDLPTAPVEPTPAFLRGVNLVDWTATGYSRPSATQEVVTLAALGTSAMAVLVTAYQPHALSPELRGSDPRTPTPSAVRRVISDAHGSGMTAAIKLHVDLDDGGWRGDIAPPDPARWFASYRTFLLTWANFAEANGVELFMVGTELASITHEETRWRGLIEDVRSIYSGQLVYAAFWDEAFRLRFWDVLDFVGVDFYQPVADRNSPSRQEIEGNWQPWIDRLQLLSSQTVRPVLLTELGYRSVDGAGIHPYRFGTIEPIDLQEQADLYEAALQVLPQHPWIRGVFWWNWLASGEGGPANTDFTPKDKPAMIEIERAWNPSGAPSPYVLSLDRAP